MKKTIMLPRSWSFSLKKIISIFPLLILILSTMVCCSGKDATQSPAFVETKNAPKSAMGEKRASLDAEEIPPVTEVVPGLGATDSENDSPPSPVSTIPGKQISDQAAKKIAEQLTSKIYLPGQEIQSLKCEFDLKFVKFDPFKGVSRINRRRVGFLNIPFIFFPPAQGLSYHDKILLKARRAVFYWQKAEDAIFLVNPRATAVLYDAKNRQLDVHPYVSSSLGSVAAVRQQLYMQRDPFLFMVPFADQITTWTLDAPTKDANVLYKIAESYSKPIGQKRWDLAKVIYTPQNIPTYCELKLWDNEQNQWRENGVYRRFTPVGDTGKVAISGRHEWTNVHGVWLINHVRGTYKDRERPKEDIKIPWEITFTDFEINPEIPEGILDWPKVREIQMDFSTPDTAIETLIECLREGRWDWVAYCTVDSPKEPIPKDVPPSPFAYLFDRVKGMRERIKLLEKKKEGENWIFKIQVPNIWSKKGNNKIDIKVVPLDGLWKADVYVGRLKFKFSD